MQLRINDSPRRGEPLLAADRRSFGPDVIADVLPYMAPLGYAPTPLCSLPALAEHLAVAALLVKDESGRSTLGSFKALGGAYAVLRLVLSEAGKAHGKAFSPADLGSPAVCGYARSLTVACATDGNHGRSVAYGARVTGCKAVIFVHAGVSESRAEAMRALGADIVRVAGSYDDSVAEAAHRAAESGWHIVSDTSWPGYEETPARVMQGYLVMVDEAYRRCRELDRMPTHVFLQAGVGGLAGAVAAHWALRCPKETPRFIVVEPDKAACLLHSSIAQRPVRIPATDPTVMAMLECYEPSLIAWRILERLAYAFMAIDDASALRAMRSFARPLAGDPFILSGESGCAGLAGLLAAAADERARSALSLDERSVVLVFNTEGATDRERYESLLALDPERGEAIA